MLLQPACTQLPLEREVMSSHLNIAVEGCCHGELDIIYDSIHRASVERGVKVDLLLICGDFQCVRHAADFESVAVPPKYRKLNTFQDYVTGKKRAPVMTIFIGGNHEASNILQSLYYGGFVAPNIYYLGFAGVVWFGGVRIAGLSGIFNNAHYRLGRFEKPPYTEGSIRSIYHVREVEIYRMAHLKLSSFPIDICLSHDWPSGISGFGDERKLLQMKPFFKDDIRSGKLGSPPLMHLLMLLQPSYWFAAHLHVKFAAEVSHHQPRQFSYPDSINTCNNRSSIHHKSDEINIDDIDDNGVVQRVSNNGDSSSLVHQNAVTISNGTTYLGPDRTRFLALDKVLPGRQFMEYISVPTQPPNPYNNHQLELSYDIEWLAILRRTHSLTSASQSIVRVPELIEPVSEAELWECEQMIRQSNADTLVIRNIEPAPIPPPFKQSSLSSSSSSSSSYYGPNSNNNNNSNNSTTSNFHHKKHRTTATAGMIAELQNQCQQSSQPQQQQQLYCEPVRMGNRQTDFLLATLGLNHICTVPFMGNGEEFLNTVTKSSIDLRSPPPPSITPPPLMESYQTTSTSSQQIQPPSSQPRPPPPLLPPLPSGRPPLLLPPPSVAVYRMTTAIAVQSPSMGSSAILNEHFSQDTNDLALVDEGDEDQQQKKENTSNDNSNVASTITNPIIAATDNHDNDVGGNDDPNAINLDD